VSIEIDLVDALRAMAEPGTARDSNDFVIVADNVRVRVEYSGGSSSSLSLSTSYDANATLLTKVGGAEAGYRASSLGPIRAVRPLSIALTRESDDDIAAKRSGVNVEHQTGETEFDKKLYIDSPTTDPEVLQAVLHQGTRAAAIALFNLGMSFVEIDGRGRVSAQMTGFVSTEPAKDKGAKMVRAFAALAAGLPKVEATGESHEALPWGGRAALGVALAIVGLTAAPIAFFGIASSVDCTEGTDEGVSLKDGCGAPGVIGLVFGLAFATFTLWLVTPYVTAKLRGRSRSSGRIHTIRIATAVLAAELAFVLASAIAFSLRIGR